jgi:hypothetical protein
VRPAHDDSQYYQCLPGGGGGPAAGGSGSSGGAGSTLRVWDQCGGKGGNCAQYTCLDGLWPGQSCPAGTSCVRLHEFYSQCRTAGSSYGACEQVAGALPAAWLGRRTMSSSGARADC